MFNTCEIFNTYNNSVSTIKVNNPHEKSPWKTNKFNDHTMRNFSGSCGSTCIIIQVLVPALVKHDLKNNVYTTGYCTLRFGAIKVMLVWLYLFIFQYAFKIIQILYIYSLMH